MRQTITIKTYPEANEGKLEKEIVADIVGGFAIHQSVNWPLAKGCVGVTHLKSGLCCGDYQTRQEARRKVLTLSKIEIGGVKLADMPACEALACWPAIHQEYIRLTRQEFDEDFYEYGLRVAHQTADLLACEVAA
jgi:hypothetical protein